MAKKVTQNGPKTREQTALEREQSAARYYQHISERRIQMRELTQRAWEERCAAQSAMQRESEALESYRQYYSEVWQSFSNLHKELMPKIRAAQRKANSEHAKMKDYFSQSSSAFQSGMKAKASKYSVKGRKHRLRRDELNEKVREMLSLLDEARAAAKAKAPPIDNQALLRAKQEFYRAKERYRSLSEDFVQLKAEEERAKKELARRRAEARRVKNQAQPTKSEV